MEVAVELIEDVEVVESVEAMRWSTMAMGMTMSSSGSRMIRSTAMGRRVRLPSPQAERVVQARQITPGRC